MERGLVFGGKRASWRLQSFNPMQAEPWRSAASHLKVEGLELSIVCQFSLNTQHLCDLYEAVLCLVLPPTAALRLP